MNVLIGICGSIAVYKICELIRLLKSKNVDVKVIMTESACKFVTPLTMQTLSQNKVYTEMFCEKENWEIEHIELARWADCFVVAPATANTISKIAMGLADNLLTTSILSRRCPLIIAPAMNVSMFVDAIFQENLNKLSNEGIYMCLPESGELACGDKGIGKLAENEKIFDIIFRVLEQRDKLKKKKIIVTAGPTREKIDAVRYISNYSSGKMGYAIAQEASLNGAEVILVSGPVNLYPPAGCILKNVESGNEMLDATLESFKTSDALIMAAAVADFTPKKTVSGKIKKSKDRFVLECKTTVDILSEISKIKKDKIIVGFAAESDDLIKNAKKKLKEKNIDMIVANDVTKGVFGSDYNEVKIIYKDGKIVDLGKQSKINIAREIVSRVVELLS